MADNLNGSVTQDLAVHQASSLLEEMNVDAMFDETEEEVTEEATTEEVDESEDITEESEPEADVEADSEDETEEEADDEASEELALETVTDVAKALELDESELLDNLKTTIKIDGEESEVTLKELQAGYQKDADYRKKTAEVAEERRAINEAHAERHKAYEAHTNVNFAVLQEAQKLIVGEQNTPEMMQLKASNPSEYLIRVDDINQRSQAFQQLINQVASNYQSAQQGNEQQTAAEKKRTFEQEQQKLASALPDLDKNALGKYMLDIGFTTDDLNNNLDHKLFVLAEKARLYDTKSTKVNLTKKKVKQAPKRMSADKPKSKLTVKKSNVSKAKSRLTKSGSMKDAASVIEQLI